MEKDNDDLHQESQCPMCIHKNSNFLECEYYSVRLKNKSVEQRCDEFKIDPNLDPKNL